MKTLKQIYQELAANNLDAKQALEQIKNLKSFGMDNTISTSLLAMPDWYKRDFFSDSDELISANLERYVVADKNIALLVKKNNLATENFHLQELPDTSKLNIASGYEKVALACFDLLAKFIRSQPTQKILIQLVFSDNQKKLILAGLSGLLKTAHLENPSIAGQIIFVNKDIDSKLLIKHLNNESLTQSDSIIRYRNEQREIFDWMIEPSDQTNLDIGANTPSLYKDNGVYVITGGLGGVGKLFVKQILTSTTCSKVIITGREAVSNSQINLKLKELLPLNLIQSNRIEYYQLDLSNQHKVVELFVKLKKAHGSLNGIIHSAGMNLDSFLLRKTKQDFSRVLEPKVIGTFNLDLASKDIKLDFLVLFSSVASCFGNLGQADYASANGFMDHFSHYRNLLVQSGKRDGKTLSINWPLWSEGGMKLNTERLKEWLDSTGISPMSTSRGMLAFDQSLLKKSAQVLVLVGEDKKLRQQFGRFNQSHSIDNRVKVHRKISTNVSTKENIDSSHKITNLPNKTQYYLREQLSSLLKIPAERIEADAPLEKYGIDSILAMNLTSQLEKTFGALSKTLFFEYQTIAELADYFVSAYQNKLMQIFGTTPQVDIDRDIETLEPESRSNVKTEVAQKNTTSIRLRSLVKGAPKKPKSELNTQEDTPIAIVGLSGRYPESDDIEQFWNNLRDGKDCIVEVPEQRWRWQDYHSEDRTEDGKHFSKWGGFISGVEEFDPRFFNISPREAETIDPQERLFLQHAWMAIEDAGFTRSRLQIPHAGAQPGQVGVYVGVMYGEYNRSGSLASIANRVSYILNLHGPSMTLDTMCSSSLTAIHLACQDLKSGRTNLAIAGGVNVSVHPGKYLMLSAGQFISSDGHCQSFGEGGDGYIPGEGVGVVVLKPLANAEQEKLPIYGIIKGSVLNHGGKTNGYSVPNPQAQADAITQALSVAKVDPLDVSYIEAHGTGTKLGDPIEIVALSKAFYQYSAKDGKVSTDSESNHSTKQPQYGFCAIGSAKSNIGHCESAAGIAGLTKVLLQMKYKQIVPSLHSSKLNPNIDFEKTPFIVNQRLKKWVRPISNGRKGVRIAGISSFGAGGSNAHLIIEEYQRSLPSVKTPIANDFSEVVFLLSARTIEQLYQKAFDLRQYLVTQLASIDTSDEVALLINLAYTLQVGREAMKQRIGFVVNSLSQLGTKIDELLALKDQEQLPEGIFQGTKGQHLSDENNSEAMSKPSQKCYDEKQYKNLLGLWINGEEIDWNKLYTKIKPSIISLPSYPFAKEKYWQSTDNNDSSGLSKKQTHPFLQQNRTLLGMSVFSSKLFASNRLLKTHPLHLKQYLSEACCLEMTHAALRESFPEEVALGTILLEQVRWGSPAIISQHKNISVALFEATSDSLCFEIFSDNESQESIHCQGYARFNRNISREKLTLEESRKKTQIENNPQHFISITRKEYFLSLESRAFVVNPAMLDFIFQQSINQRHESEYEFILQGIDSVSIYSACKSNMDVQINKLSLSESENTHYSMDISGYNEQGALCFQLSGVNYLLRSFDKKIVEKEPIGIETGVSLAQQELSSNRLQELDNILLPEKAIMQENDHISVEKPSTISLINPEQSEKLVAKVSTKEFSKIQLIQKGSAQISLSEVNADRGLTLVQHDAGVFELKILSGSENKLTTRLIGQLNKYLHRLKQENTIKVLVLSGSEEYFISGGLDEHNKAIELNLYNQLVDFPYPIIAAMDGNAVGVGFFIASICDFIFCSEEGQYGFSAESHFNVRSIESQLLNQRFKFPLANQLTGLSSIFTGIELKQLGATFTILAKGEVLKNALIATQNIADKSRQSLALLKAHLVRHIKESVECLTNESDIQVVVSPTTEIKDNSPKVTSKSKQIVLSEKNQVLRITIDPAKNKNQAELTYIELTSILKQLEGNGYYKAILITNQFAAENIVTQYQLSEKVVLDLTLAFVSSPIPIISTLSESGQSLDWFVSLFCDACVYTSEVSYSASQLLQYPLISKQAMALFILNFGDAKGKDILFRDQLYTGNELGLLVPGLLLDTANSMSDKGAKLSQQWSTYGIDFLMEFKDKNRSIINRLIKSNSIGKAKSSQDVISQIEEITPVKLNSSVVNMMLHPGGVLVIEMMDKNAKNMFSPELVEGLYEAFEHIKSTAEYKVVVLTGYDSYFASGGTKETLVAIQEGKLKFTDNKIYQLAIKCQLPVVAAIQGHGIGAGWVLGMFSDFVFMSEESHYVSPYMGYGFTPGAGSTMIFPHRIGEDLARETLLTAYQFSGRELKSRNIPVPVLARQLLLPEAMKLANQLSRISREELLAFKQQWTLSLHQELAETYQLELEMHEQTFVGQTETLARIEQKFENKKVVQKTTSEVIIEASIENHPLSTIVNNLKKLLAQELYLEIDEIDEGSQFVDLGLDSITGVTWLRKINQKYQTVIEATQVYSYPTLFEFAEHLKQQLDELAIDTTVSSQSSQSADLKQNQNLQTPNLSKSDNISLSKVLEELKDLLAQELYLETDEIDENAQFTELGLDSITGVTWIRNINQKYSIEIDATKVYSYPSLLEFSQHVEQLLAHTTKTLPNIEISNQIEVKNFSAVSNSSFRLSQLASWRGRTRTNKVKISNRLEIAVIGMAGQFPKAENLTEFWKNIAEAKDCIDEVGDNRWSITSFYQPGDAVPGKTNSKWLGGLDNFDQFDPLFFNISPSDAECMDPQQRLFLQACWHGIENAGYRSSSLSGTKCGVFVGCAGGDYHLGSREQQLTAEGFTGEAVSILSARISYFLNLQGPCLAIDTACSSSLVAIANACDSLNQRDSDLALAGGVYVMSGPGMHIKSSQSGMLSTDGRCFTFDNRANGFVMGEGVGVVVLKRLEDAEQDKDLIQGVIRGWGVNQDGKTNGITAPNAQSQTRLEQTVYDKFHIDPSDIQLIEAHGTGTSLGDPIEIEGLKGAFEKYTTAQNYCAVGSVKSNIGHCLTAAGISGFIKLMLALKAQQLPPSINFEELNQHIKLNNSPFYINEHLRPWEVDEGSRRQAAISSFGFSGTNAHIVVAEHTQLNSIPVAVSVINEQGRIILPLSAKTELALRQKATALLELVQSKELDLVSLAFSLQTSRDSFNFRLGFLVGSIQELIHKLKDYIDDKSGIEGIYKGQVQVHKKEIKILTQDEEIKANFIAQIIKNSRLSKLAELWTKGLAFEWSDLYISHKPARIELPLYPFAKERYWLDGNIDTRGEQQIDKRQSGKIDGVSLPPLLHQNTSDLAAQSYTSWYGENDFYLSDYIVSEQRVLPIGIELEMIREALQHALPESSVSSVIKLYDIEFDSLLSLKTVSAIKVSLYETSDKTIDFELYSEGSESGIIYCRGSALVNKVVPVDKPNLAKLKSSIVGEQLNVAEVYKLLAQGGARYGESCQRINQINIEAGELLAKLNSPTDLIEQKGDYLINSSLLDSGFQAAQALLLINKSNKLVEFSEIIDSLAIYQNCTQGAFVWVRLSENKRQQKIDIDWLDSTGNLCIQAKGITFSLAEVNLQEIQLDKRLVIDNEESAQTLFYKEEWINDKIQSKPSSEVSRSTLIFAQPTIDLGKQALDSDSLFASTVVVTRANKYRQLSERAYECRFNSQGDIEIILQQLNKNMEQPIGIIYSWSQGEEEKGVDALFSLFKAVKESRIKVEHITLVGCYEPSKIETCWDYSWIGFERSLKLLLPEVELSLLYTDSGICNYQQLAEGVNSRGIYWYQGEQRKRLSLQAYEPQTDGQEELVQRQVMNEQIVKQQGHYLITGGSGALGMKFANYLATQYQARLSLLGRRSQTPDISQKIVELKQSGAKSVDYYPVDICDKKAVLQLSKKLSCPVDGIIHAAGVESNQDFTQQSIRERHSVMGPKTLGTVLLDEIFNTSELDFVSYFSSSAAILGDLGSCDYAIGNRFQMAYARYREETEKSAGQTRVINWPFWKSGGMGQGADDGQQTALYLKTSGQQGLETSQGLDIWHQLMRGHSVQTLVMVGQPSRVNGFLERLYVSDTTASNDSKTTVDITQPPIEQSKACSVVDRRQADYQQRSIRESALLDLKRLISTFLKIDAVMLDETTNLADYGFNSINLATFAKQLSHHWDISVTPALFFSAATIGQLADYFAQDHAEVMEVFYTQSNEIEAQTKLLEKNVRIEKMHAPKPSRRRLLKGVKEVSLPAVGNMPVAIVGLSGRFPAANTPDEFWSLLQEERSGIKEIPATRWNWRDYFSAPGASNNRISTNQGGFIDAVDEFDPLFFEISPKEAEEMDPGERLLLMEAYKAIEDARISPASLRGKAVGVFVGMEESQYGGIAKGQGVTTGGNAMISSRLSYYLDFHGPTIATNTACSSGLVALHQASMSLKLGECESALVAGVALSLLPENCIKMSQAGMLSPDGQCFSFSRHANGIGFGEAVVVLMLKPLIDAENAGDPIYGVIRGSGINFDGKTNGVTAPNGRMQSSLIESVYRDNQIDVDRVSHIVTHGTGTKLGDPVELNGLVSAFKQLNKYQDVATSSKCAITSCKSNVGHTMAASGLVSVIGLLKGIEHRVIPASLHCEEENDYINWEESHFYINKKTQSWNSPAGVARIGGVSAFGRSGTNAHVVIEEYLKSSQPTQIETSGRHSQLDVNAVLIPLSARTELQLKQKAQDLIAFISQSKTNNRSLSVIDMAFSLQVTREAMEYRAGFVVNSFEQLEQKLQAYIDGEQKIANFYQGQLQSSQANIDLINNDDDMMELVDKWIKRRKLSKLLELWVKGFEFNWRDLYDSGYPKKIKLPVYPFAKEKYWVVSRESHDIDSGELLSNLDSIEGILNKITDETIETDEAIGMLNALI